MAATAGSIHYIPREDVTDVTGERLDYKVRNAATGGASMAALLTAPPGSGPPAIHMHPVPETFYIVAGAYEFAGINEAGRYAFRASAGDVVHIPPGVAHNYKSVGEGTNQALLVITPGSMEGFFTEWAAMFTERAGAPEMAKAMAICAKYQITFAEPLPQG
jgi:quercetin dioxygenase-like cupin family protein